MQVGDLVRAIGFDFSGHGYWLMEKYKFFVVLETRNERGCEELRLHFSEIPFLEQYWCLADYFEVV